MAAGDQGEESRVRLGTGSQPKARVVLRRRRGDAMTSTDAPKPEEGDTDDEDDWQNWASADYGGAVDPWDDLEVIEVGNGEDDDLEDHDDDDYDIEIDIRNLDAPPCPAPLGVIHVIRLGACDHCLSRICGRARKGISAAKHGAAVRSEMIERDPDLAEGVAAEWCPFCEDLFDDVEPVVGRLLSRFKEWSFSQMQIGVHLPKDLIKEEDRLRTKFGATGSRPLKSSYVEAIQHALSAALPDVEMVKERPEVMVLIDSLTLRVEVDVRPVFVYGRYRKLDRGIPQTRWPCRACRGRDGGCESCEGSGLQYRDSVQDLIGEPAREMFDAEQTSFHGMGREDIDVRCLGRGRPFVLELKRPRRRTTDLQVLTDAIVNSADGKVSVSELRMSMRNEVSRIKETRAEKSYTIRFTVDGGIEDEATAIAAMESLAGVELSQQTPKRVAHRRADMVRKRTVVAVSDVTIDGDELEFRVRCQAGTYVKELVHSDDGRTKPSVAGLLGAACEVLSLDVEEIHAD